MINPLKIFHSYFSSFINLFDKYISVKTALTSPFPQTHSLSIFSSLIYDCSARAGKVAWFYVQESLMHSFLFSFSHSPLLKSQLPVWPIVDFTDGVVEEPLRWSDATVNKLAKPRRCVSQVHLSICFANVLQICFANLEVYTLGQIHFGNQNLNGLDSSTA